MRHDLQAILDDLERDVERATEIASLRFEMAVKAKLKEWRERFPGTLSTLGKVMGKCRFGFNRRSVAIINCR